MQLLFFLRKYVLCSVTLTVMIGVDFTACFITRDRSDKSSTIPRANRSTVLHFLLFRGHADDSSRKNVSGGHRPQTGYVGDIGRNYSKRNWDEDKNQIHHEASSTVGHVDAVPTDVPNPGEVHSGKGFELLFTSNNATYENYPLQVEGEIPDWLTGTLIKNGPGLFEMGPMSFTHLLDGYSKLAKFTFTKNQTLLFSTRFITTNSYNSARKTSRIAPYLLFSRTNPPFNWYEKVCALYNEADNTNINVYSFPSKFNNQSNAIAQNTDYVALSDFWHVYKFDPVNLHSAIRIKPPVPGHKLVDDFLPLISTSHPIRELGKTSLVTILSVLNPLPDLPSSIHVVRIQATQHREQIAEINVHRLSYMHSFALTKHHAIVFADPLFVDFEKTFDTVTLAGSFVWDEDSPTTVFVVNTETGEFWNVTINPSVHLHHINSYESHGKIIIDYVVYPTINMVYYKLNILKDARRRNRIKQDSKIVRYIIDIDTRSIRRIKHKKSGHAFIRRLDFPAINEAFRFKSYCYIYGIVSKMDGHDLSRLALVKKDICHTNSLVWTGANLYPSEAVFVQRESSHSEDDGILLTLVLDGNKDFSFVLILNATTFAEVARAYLPTHVPFTVHGRFFPEL